jgi:glycosyltransferase involved in cell wall biosynthesis
MSQVRPYDVIIITMSRWDGPYSSAILSLAKELAKTRRVFYVDHPYSLKDLLKDWSNPALQKRKGRLLFGSSPYQEAPNGQNNFVSVTPGLTLPINWLPGGMIYEQGSRFNDWILNKCLNRLIRDYQIDEFVFINSFDPFFFRKFNPRKQALLRIYQSRDDISQEAYIARHGIRLEQEQIDQSDLALATSTELSKRLSQPQKPVYLLPNAANYQHFEQAAEVLKKPIDFPTTQKPVLGYIGNISPLRFDFELVKNLARELEDYEIVLIGKHQGAEALAAFENIHLLGPKGYNQLPQYLSYFDCCMIPFQHNQLTKSIYPLKINEYLAAGKAVVSTRFSEDVEAFGSAIELADDASSFARAVRNSVKNKSAEEIEKRQKLARENSWELRKLEFERLVEMALKQNNNTWAA